MPLNTSPIALLEKDEVPTLMDTDKANELIKYLNVLINMRVIASNSSPPGLLVTRDGATLIVPKLEV